MFPVKDHLTMPVKNQPINLIFCNVPLNSAVDDLPPLRSLENHVISQPPSLFIHVLDGISVIFAIQSAKCYGNSVRNRHSFRHFLPTGFPGCNITT